MVKKFLCAADPWEQTVVSRNDFNELSTEDKLQYFCQFGILAPTSHNSVPQRFRVNSDDFEIEVIIDRKFVLAYSDRVGRQATVSLGCVVESIVLVAEWYGLHTEITQLTDAAQKLYPHVAGQERYVSVVRLRFSQEKQQELPEYPWPQLMLERKVIRAEYDRTQAVEAALLEQLVEGVQQRFPAVHLHIVEGMLSLRGFGKFQENADRFVMENPQFARELGEWLLPNTEAETPYAMRGAEFGFDDDFAQTVHLGLSGKQRLLPDQIAAFAKGGKVGVESSAAVAVLTVATDDVKSRIDAGRAYLWSSLVLWQSGFANAVHAGITEVDWVTTMFAATVLRTTRRPDMVFRIGKPKRAVDWQRPHARRPGLQSVLVESDDLTK